MSDSDKENKELSKQEKMIGVFSTKVVSKVGTGHTAKKVIRVEYYYAEEDENGEIALQVLGDQHVPVGEVSRISKDELIQKYDPEPEVYTKEVFPKIRTLEKTIARAERYRKQGQHFSAEFEYGAALKVDEQNVRATFGLGLIYLDQGEKAKAEDILARLVKLPAAFETEHKHLFNDFGINLRKQKMYEQALDYYQRALEFSAEDENLHYNVARAAMELEDYKACVAALKTCLKINPEHQYARKMGAYLKKKGLIPKQ